MSIAGLDVRNNRVMIDVACNDPDNGIFCHRAHQIQVGYQFAELEAKRDPAPRFTEEDDDRITMSGKSWPTHGSKEWVGNWCWNGYWMDIPTAVDFLVWLHRRNLFALTCGDDRLFQRWKRA